MQNNEADLIGLDDEGVANEGINSQNNVQSNKSAQQAQQPPQQQGNVMDDIFSAFNNMGPTSNTTNTNTASQNDPFGMFNFAGGGAQNAPMGGAPSSIFQNSNQYPTTRMENSGNQNGVSIQSQFQRNNGVIQLGLFGQGLNGPCQLVLDNNPFGLTCQNNGSSSFNNGTAMFQISMDPSHFNRQPPSHPFIIQANLNANGQQFNLQINLNIVVLLAENSKLSGNPFVQFFQQNKDQQFNQNVFTYPKYNNEDNVKMIFERNNIYLSAKQNKANPPTSFFSTNILGNMPVLVQEFLNNGIINIKIITNNASIVPLMKDVIDHILN
jgi:hypothetical protein